MALLASASRIQICTTDFGLVAFASHETESCKVWCEGPVPERTIVALTFGWSDPSEAMSQLMRMDPDIDEDEPAQPTRLEQSWVRKLERFTAGKHETFWQLPIDVSGYTPFQLAVATACREIPYGETRSYGELAAIVGSPRAARAVGNVMRTNRYPLVVPCHRVVGSGGSLGGYSAKEGLTTKQRLLLMENDYVSLVAR